MKDYFRSLIRALTSQNQRNLTRRLLSRCGIPAARSVSVYPEDTFVVSYPRSGNTWMRFMVADLLFPTNDVGFHNIEDLIPDIYLHADFMLNRYERPRVLKSHEYYDPRYPYVIYLVRDPRDIALSYYNYHKKTETIPPDYPLSEYVKEYVRGDLNFFGPWNEHVGSWVGAKKKSSDFLLIKYENLLKNPVVEFQKVAEFMGKNITRQEAEGIVERNTYSSMQKKEKEQSSQWEALRNTRDKENFVNKGEAGYWKEKLPESFARRIEQNWKPVLETLNYETF